MAAPDMVASPAIAPRANPLTDAASWTAMRNACIADPGAFHGDHARSAICWYLPDLQAWGYFDRDAGAWTGWDAATGRREDSICPPNILRGRAD